ncbi:MAG: recombination protein RecR [Desulfobulbaceae bacterium]|nr:MAG: recombination protein RecR [Desulfobulbaceae bacterium]
MSLHIVPPALERLINSFSSLPGIGAKTATRLALNLLRRKPSDALEMAEALSELHRSIQLCSICLTFSEDDPCAICADPKRDGSMVCVVEQPGDLLAIEKTDSYRGHYHILHGVLSPIDGIGPDELKVRELIARIKSGTIKEILIATSSTVPGEATASFLIDKIHGLPVKLTRLACGIPMGMDIKHADKYTLARAISSRENAS